MMHDYAVDDVDAHVVNVEFGVYDDYGAQHIYGV